MPCALLGVHLCRMLIAISYNLMMMCPVHPFRQTHVWTTHTTVGTGTGSLTWYFALSLVQEGALEPVTLVRADLWPVLAADADVVVWDHARPAGSATLIKGGGGGDGGDAALAVLEGDGHAYRLVAPVMASGWAVLGELGKLTPVSVQRRWSFSEQAGGGVAGLSIIMHGAPGEICSVAAWRAGTVHTHSVVMDAAGIGATVFTVTVSPLLNVDV